MRRSNARELFMQMLFHMEAQKNYSEQMKQTFIQANEEYYRPSDYFDRMFAIVGENLHEIDYRIDISSSNWKVDRMDRVDLAILRVSVAEILYMEDIPDSVSINEAVELAKKFGTEESGKFVNGLLGNVAREQHHE